MNPIRRIRTRILHVTQEAFAKATGTRQAVVSAWETGLYDPKMSSLARILAAYPSLDARELFKSEDEDNENAEKVVLGQDVAIRPAAREGGDAPSRDPGVVAD